MPRGRKRQPSAVLKSRGSRVAKQREQEEVPTLPPAKVRLPAWLPRNAKTVWRNLVPLLQSRRLLGEEDLRALERYCLLYDQWRTAYLDVKRNGQLVTETTREGNQRTVANPSVKLLIDFGKELSRLEAKFGLSPQDRAGLHVAPHREPPAGEAKSPFESSAGRKPKRKTG